MKQLFASNKKGTGDKVCASAAAAAAAAAPSPPPGGSAGAAVDGPPPPGSVEEGLAQREALAQDLLQSQAEQQAHLKRDRDIRSVLRRAMDNAAVLNSEFSAKVTADAASGAEPSLDAFEADMARVRSEIAAAEENAGRVREELAAAENAAAASSMDRPDSMSSAGGKEQGPRPSKRRATQFVQPNPDAAATLEEMAKAAGMDLNEKRAELQALLRRRSVPLRSRNAQLIFHVDDMSNTDLPSPIKAATGDKLERHYVPLTGVDETVREWFTAFVFELGVGSKDSSYQIDVILMAVVQKLAGEKAILLAFDCGPLMHNSFVAMFLPSLLVSLGLFESAVAMFFETYHSKSW